MMHSSRGLTLIETLFALAILLFGLLAVVVLFQYSAYTNMTNQQRSAATALLHDKMEQFKSSPLNDSVWVVGGNLNPESPGMGYYDYVTIGSGGMITSSTADPAAPYMRIWRITDAVPRRVTVIVFAEQAALTRKRLELIRATTLKSTTF